MFSLELQHQSRKQKTPTILLSIELRTLLELKITNFDVTSNAACGVQDPGSAVTGAPPGVVLSTFPIFKVSHWGAKNHEVLTSC